MRDDYWIIPVIFVTVVVIVMLLMAGSKMEASRIYDNCLKNNGTMTYADVDKMCKDIVK